MSSPIAEKIIAEHLLNINAIMFLLENPIRFKSGLISPIYVDNRCLIFHPAAWHDVLETMSSNIAAWDLKFDVIAGVETAGIPHSSALAYRLNLPSIFVRKKPKTHGTQNRVEGGDVKGKRVLLIEDHISTGFSSLDSVVALRASGAIVEDCVSITSYDFAEAKKAFAEAEVKAHTLLPFNSILQTAVETKRFNEEQKNIIADWLADPWPWAAKHGHLPAMNEN